MSGVGREGVALRIEHVALWARDLERMRAFYVEALGGRCGPMYENPRTGLRSYFVCFGDGARVELMSRPDVVVSGPSENRAGWAHVAFRVGSRDAVDRLVSDLETRGVAVVGRPRTTGDGYYEAVVEDPEGNPVELTA